MKITIKDIANAISFLFGLMLIGIGFAKGFEIIELSFYYIYLISTILAMVMNLFERGKNEST